jgi:arabinogalactan endo-1,4-beta-galactosidase
MKISIVLLALNVCIFSFSQQNSWWQEDGSLKIESAEHTFRSPIVHAKDNIRESEMLLVDLNVYRSQAQEGIQYGIFSKDLSQNAHADIKVFHRKPINPQSNPNTNPNYGFDFKDNDYLVYGCKASENYHPSFTNQEENWGAYGYYAHGWNFTQTQIKSTDFEHLWNRPKSATWWDTLYDVTIGVLAVVVVVGTTIATAGAAAALIGGITVAGTATISISAGTIAAALYTAGASLYVTYSIYMYQGYLLDSVDNRGYSEIIAQSEFETNMELPLPDKILNPSTDEEKKWNESITAIEKSAFNCSDVQEQKCYKAPIKEMVVEMTIKNSHVKYVNIPGELHKNITPYQLFENYNYIIDEGGVISTSSFTQDQLLSAADYFDSKRQVLPKNMLRPTEEFTFDLFLENFNGVPTYYIASKTPPNMDALFYLDLGLYGEKNGHDYHLYRIQVGAHAEEIPFSTGPDGPFLVGDNIELEEKLYDDLTINVYRDEESPIITKSYSISQPNPAESLRLQPGDSVVFTSRFDNFFLEGIPEIWLARSGGDSKYYCSPNTKPNEFRPFLGYDSQVHGVALRKHPDPDNKKTPSLIHNEEANTYSWYWIAQRRMDSEIDSKIYSSLGGNMPLSKFKKASDLGKTDFPVGGGERVTKQRNNQREGYNMQLLYAWEDRANFTEYNGPEFILGLDPDEIIYLNCNGAKIPSPDTGIPDALLSVNKEEWKKMPEGEDVDPVVKMVEAYVKNRSYIEDNISYDDFDYHGYEIMDEGIFRETTIAGVSTDNAPCNGKPCVEYSNGSSEEDNNIKAPGEFRFKKVYPDGIHTGSPINIHVDLESVQQTDYGFYGSIEGDQWPSEWQKQVPYSFKGLDGLSDSTLNKLVMEYSHENELGILTTDTRYFRDSGSVVDGKWTEYFDLKGWGYNEITVYVQRKPGATKVPIAGMELLEVMLRFVSAPGSKWKDFSPTPFEGIDLKEGRGEGNYWYLRDSNEDESNHFLYGNPSDVINKSYTISKGDRIVFNAMDSDPHTFFHYDVEWYVSERFMSKRLSTEELDTRVQWFLAPIDYDGLGEWVGNGRWLDKTFDFHGKYRLTAVYGLDFDKNNDTFSNNTRMSHIINVLSAPYDSSDDAKKGTIDIYEMSSDQIEWVQQIYPEIDSSWRVASINNIFSRWTHVDGPRTELSNDKPNRYGNENDYNAHFEWFENNGGREDSIDRYSLQEYVIPDTNLDWFPYNWIRHYSGSSLPNDMDISLVSGGVTTSQEGIDNALRNAFPKDTPEHWQWRLPWVSITNWQGYKIRNNIKVVFNMQSLFDNQIGAFSGTGVEHISNEAYANRVKSPIPAYTDNYKSKYDFYLDLLSGRKQIFNPNDSTFFGSLSVNQVNDSAEDQADVNSVVITKPNFNYKEDGSFLMGADMSIIKNLEDGGITWKRSEIAKSNEDPYFILSSSGANTVRLRLWINPKKTDGSDYPYSRLLSVKQEILRAKDKGLKVILDLHYSDTWADPNQNIIPTDWVHGISETSTDGNVNFLASQIETYTKFVLDELYRSNALPDIVQVGNEINGNILLTDSYQSLTVDQIATQIGVSVSDLNDDKYKINWDRNARLINTGLLTIKNNYPEVKTMLHLASPFFTLWWLNEAFNENTTNRLGNEIVNQDLVDIVGMSYYLGELDQQQSLPVVKQIIDNIGDMYDKKVLIVETAFPQTYDWSDNTPNLYSELNNGGWPHDTNYNKQYNWLLTLRETLKTSPYSIGFMYWEPFWVGSKSVETKDFIGSNWENMSFCSYANGVSIRDNIVNINGGLKAFNDPILNLISENKGDSFKRQGIDQENQSSKLSFEKSKQPDFKVYVTPKDENLIISLFPAAKYDIRVYDLQGKLIHSGLVNNVNSHLVYLNKLGFRKQIILIEITDENGNQQVKKLIVR